MASSVHCLRFYPITIQRKTTTTDAYGGRTETWSAIANTRATVEPLSGSEQFRGLRLKNPVTHRFRFRYRNGITGADRIVFRNRVFNIRSVIDENENKRWLNVLAEENVDG